jgi:hypothetical protein
MWRAEIGEETTKVGKLQGCGMIAKWGLSDVA